MKTQNTGMSHARTPSSSRALLAMILVAANLPVALAQSSLRFVDAGGETTIVAPVKPVTTVAPAPARPSELHFVEAEKGILVSPPTLNAAARPTISPPAGSTLTLVPAQQPAAMTSQQSNAWDLRLLLNRNQWQRRPVQTSPARMQVAQPRPQTSFQSALPNPSVVANAAPPATELFGSLPTQRAAEVGPRLASLPQPGPVAAPKLVEPQRISALPARPNSPIVLRDSPAGTELFTSAEPKRWDLPALDYGAALKQVEPPKPVVAAAKPLQPMQVVAKPFIEPRSPASFVASPPQRPAPMQVPAAQELDFANVRIPVRPKKPAFTAAPPTVAELPAPVAAPVEQLVPAAATPVFAPPIVTSTIARNPVVVRPAASRPMVAAAKPEPRFAETPNEFAPTEVAHPPIARPVAVATPKPLLASLPVSRPAIRPDAVPATAQNVAVVEPAPLATSNFRFAATTESGPASTGISAAPVSLATVADEPAPVMTEDLSAPCGCNGSGCSDCPYGCGQSGTRVICGVDCGNGGAPCCSTWSDSQCIPWSLFGPGEYVGPARPEHVSTYFLRVNDFITLTFIESRKKSAEHYRIGVGDRLQIEWLQGAANAETPLNRELLVQPDGTVTLPLVGEVAAAGKTINEFRDEVVKFYSKYQRDPQITVTPLSVNVGIQDLLKAVTPKTSTSGQTQDLRVTPEGTIQAAGIGSVYVQGLTLDELRSELEARYAAAYGPGLTVSPALTERATSYVFLGGEVKVPGRYTLEGPTTVMQAIALAGGWNIGGNVRQVVIFRRDENWCLKATKIDVRAPLYGQDPCPVNDVWLRENDLVIVPKSRILCATDVINLYFTRGVYAVFPINYVYDFSQNSGLVPIP